jgi:transcription elongation factor GreB
MSKAFVKETDNEEDDDQEIKAPSIPPGSKNYITPAGAKRLKDELHELLTKKRPEITAVITWAASNGDRSENADYTYGKRRLREIDKRIRFLEKRIEAFDIVDSTRSKSNLILFGATVTLLDEEEQTKIYSIVGIDEANAGQGRISWISPLAKALLKARVGDVVSFKTPKGTRELEVVKIVYQELP